MYAAYGDILRQKWVYYPEWGAEQCYVFDENSVALVEVDKLRAESVLWAELSFVHVHSVFCHLKQSCSTSRLLADNAFFPSVMNLSTPFPPSVVFSATIDGTLAGDGNVCLLIGIDARLQVPAVNTFPACGDDGVEFGLESEQKDTVFLDVKVYLAEHGDGTSNKGALRDNHSSATVFGTSGYGLVDGLLVVGSLCLGAGTEVGDVVRLVFELRLSDVLFDLFVLCIPSVCHGCARNKK